MDKMLKTFNISQTPITIKMKIKIISSAELFLKINDDGGYRKNWILLKTNGGARGNPGEAGVRAVSFLKEKRNWKYI